jgi:hypothetical protein
MRLSLRTVLLLIVLLLGATSTAQARTVYRCIRSGTVSLATAPEPGSRCEAKQIDDDTAKVPDMWGASLGGLHHGILYRREQDGQTVYSTRDLPGSVKMFAFTVQTPKDSPAHFGLGSVGPPRLDMYASQFRDSSKTSGVEDALLRAIAHAESGFDSRAVSPKGAQGVMQLMPATARLYGVIDPFSAKQSIGGGARQLKALMKLYKGNRTLVAAAYNAGVGAVARYGGVPPYAETRAYVEKVDALYARYRAALSRR